MEIPGKISAEIDSQAIPPSCLRQRGAAEQRPVDDVDSGVRADLAAASHATASLTYFPQCGGFPETLEAPFLPFANARVWAYWATFHAAAKRETLPLHGRSRLMA